MNLIEGWGTGLPRLFEACKEMNLPEPEFKESGDGIKVTIYRAKGDTQIGTGGPDNESNESNTKSNESNRESNEANQMDEGVVQDRILQLIMDNPKISQRKLANEIGVARSTIQRHIAKLVENGEIQWSGSTRGFWILQGKR